MLLAPKNSLLTYGLVAEVLTLLCLIKCDTNSSETVNFCDETYVDSAYFNGYDIIVTRDDWLWYYYKDYHNLSAPFSQKAFTQGNFRLKIAPTSVTKRPMAPTLPMIAFFFFTALYI